MKVYSMTEALSFVTLTGDPEKDAPFAPIKEIPEGGALGYIKLLMGKIEAYG